MIDKFLMIGGGVLEERGGHFFVKAALAEYLKGMTRYFRSVAFMGQLSFTQHSYSTSLDELGVNAYPWRAGAAGLMASAKVLWHCLDQQTGVWIQLPQVSLFPLMLLVRLRAKRMLAYGADDWGQIARRYTGADFLWKRPLFLASVSLPLRWADCVLVRGPKLLALAQRYNSRVVESLPIISSGQGYTLRNDSCQNTRICVLYVGKLLLSKGVGILLEAMALLDREGDLKGHFALRLVGDGKDRSEITVMARRLGLEDSVEFWGYCDDPAQLGQAFAEADLLVVPSMTHPEGMPRVLEEGLRHSLPVVATQVGGIPLAYEDGLDLVLAKPGSSEELAKAMARVVRNGTLRRSLIARARQRASKAQDGLTASQQHARLLLGEAR
ncbi:MAG: glycosyltransferase [Desulfarculaceae bacterium]|nr:glycosyltransferase [Desulfarculaceae bacterium]MCF8118281.1 glycosyltransferase [Desulfarculaceae bacterium]